jgi:hypothetical protein
MSPGGSSLTRDLETLRLTDIFEIIMLWERLASIKGNGGSTWVE